MVLDEEALRSVIAVIDLTMQIERDKLVWQSIATSQFGENAEKAFQMARANPGMLKEAEIQLADITKLRNQFALMLEKALKGEPSPPPIERVN